MNNIHGWISDLGQLCEFKNAEKSKEKKKRHTLASRMRTLEKSHGYRDRATRAMNSSSLFQGMLVQTGGAYTGRLGNVKEEPCYSICTVFE